MPRTCRSMSLTVVAANSSATTVHLTRCTSRPTGSNATGDAESAIHGEHDARHERRRVAAQPLHRPDDLLRSAEPSHGCLRDDRAGALGIGAVRMEEHTTVLLRHEEPRSHRVHTHAVAPGFFVT